MFENPERDLPLLRRVVRGLGLLAIWMSAAKNGPAAPVLEGDDG
jgi:hypothetical protein